MPEFKCPVCALALEKHERSFRCENGHGYDLARQGYVNLLMSNRSSGKRHGDDKLMVLSRKNFLDKGYYSPLLDKIKALALEYCGSSAEMLDIGCGEGWYTSAVGKAFADAGRTCRASGIDISKEALIQAHKRDGELSLAVAGVNALPFMDGSFDLLLNVFAPNDDREFHRVLKKGGIYLKAVPLERHLFGLKAAVYDKPYENPPAAYAPEGFNVLGRHDVCYTLRLDNNEDIKALFMMTPYYYKTGREDQQKLDTLTELETEIAFGVFLLQRK